MAAGRPSWVGTAAHAVTHTNMTADISLNSSAAGRGSGWGAGSGSGSGRPAWVSGEREGGVFTVVKYLNLVGNPVLYGFMLIGLCLAISTATRRNIRHYSSAVYLSVMFFCDLVWVTGNFLPDYAVSVNKNLHFNDGVCMYIQAFRFIGRIGTSLIIIALVLERVLLLAKPARFAGLAKPRVAIIICVMCLLAVTGVGGYYMHDSQWNSRSEKCTYRNAVSRKTMAPQSLLKIGIIGATLLVQVILNITLGVLIYHKRRYRASDPIQNSLANARRYTKQLNRINLIAFIMSLQYIITNVPLLVAPSIYWKSLTENLIDFGTLKLIVKIIDLASLFLVASRAFLVCMASPKIRKEAWMALTCKDDSTNTKRLAIDIQPSKQTYCDRVLDDSKRNSLDKNIEI